jgi:hypothetical protein
MTEAIDGHGTRPESQPIPRHGVFMIRKPFLLCSAGLLLAVAACDSSTGVSSSITQADANDLALQMDAVSTLSPSDFGLGPSFSVVAGGSGAAAVSAPISINNQFTVTRACPKGGHVALAGTITGTGDATTHSLSVEAAATRTDTNCAFQTKNGTLTLNGNPNITYDGHLNIVNAALSGLQTQTHKGSFSWARVGGSGVCDVDITSSYDPATHTATVSGTFCGIAVNATQTRGT